MQFSKTEQELIDEYYPHGEDGFYEGIEEDICPWTFTSDEVTPEEFLVLIDTWLGRNTLAFTHAGRLPYKEENAHRDHYEYMTYKFNKIWNIHINENMGLAGIYVHQTLPKHFQIHSVQVFVNHEYIDENGERQDVDQRSTTHND